MDQTTAQLSSKLGKKTAAAADDDLVMYETHESVYVCLHCGTHLSLKRQLMYKKVANNSYHGVFENLVNVRYDNMNLVPANKQCPAQKIYCQVCSTDLGFEWVKEKNPKISKNAGRFIVYLDKMMLRQNGEFCNAVTEKSYHLNALRNQSACAKDLEDMFECHHCKTHITPHNTWIRRYFQNCKWYTLFEFVYDFFTQFCYIFTSNTILDTSEVTNSEGTSRSIYCKKCNTYLGFKLVKVAKPDKFVVDGTYLLFTDKLRLLKGGKICDAVTGKPYEKECQPQNESSAEARRVIMKLLGLPDAATDKQENSVTSVDVGEMTLNIKVGQKSRFSFIVKRRVQISKVLRIRAVLKNKRKNQPNL